MDTLKILQLLETTDPQKLAQLEKTTRFAPTAAQTANEMLNEDLFGTPAANKTRKSATESTNRPLHRSNPITRGTRKKAATESAGFRRANGYRSTEEPTRKAAADAKECIKAPVSESDASWIFDEQGKGRSRRSTVAEGCGKGKCKADEAVVETGDSKFPEEFDFDAEKFGDEYGIDAETISCTFVEEDPDAKIAEHVELSFTYEDSKVILSIFADGAVTETVDAEEVDAQFSANFAEEEDEDGNKQTVLHVDLIDEEGDDDTTTDDVSADDDATESAEGNARSSIRDKGTEIVKNAVRKMGNGMVVKVTPVSDTESMFYITKSSGADESWEDGMHEVSAKYLRPYVKEIEKALKDAGIKYDLFFDKNTVLHIDFAAAGSASEDVEDDAPVDDVDGGVMDLTEDEIRYKSIIRKLTAIPDDPEAEDELRDELTKSGLTEDEIETVFTIKSETPAEDVGATMSEGDADHVDEDGANVTDEFVEEPGLNLDPVYSKDHGMEVAKGYDAGTMPGYRANEAAARKGCKSAPCATESKKGATESLAAKIIRTSK